MAFDQHLEADRIDDFNLFSNFVRLPLLILGGVLGGSKSSHPEDEDGDENDIMDCSSDGNADVKHTTKHPPPSPSSRIVSDNDMDESDSVGGLKRTKKMSWSDESGLRLVEYNDECLPHRPASAPQPAKSALKRAHPPYQSERGPVAESAKRYLPRMGGSSTLNMPARPFGSSQADPAFMNGAEMSPQYGFYINITPPTPEMYHNNSTSGGRLSRTDVSGAPTLSSHLDSTTSKSLEGKHRHQNHVFANLQSSAAPMGWTSVPI